MSNEFNEKPIKQEQEIKFLTCPNCRLAVRMDDVNHVNECHGRVYKKPETTEDKEEIKLEKRQIKNPPPGKRAVRRVAAKAM